ncbi:MULTISPECIES: PQQ-dependent sugar dehydrogenase [Pantoea]|jgi:glucose/arabinose dehydrogenase|uniref:Sorbosone dehydrogenase family protein n=1 Tax=Pantoea piersonii TaxID=2364647 RepID=A0AAJ5U873_9GAMM|nr:MULTISPECIES: sorbosone dehydrogenase family protein [Pantoea]MDU6433409.1 sorbosone dehydrogenase family protein [Pantoea sp.]MBZ6384956.1 sorbosone dehydrogenase family protein [Pantoea piersonii]MBZ6399175.1 sorbosone dehydrogenase family protein [Pantoea piersonii]MBZ6407720.1 sorbosone dehydrogenase family protein [Pantoea piersonii]MBZ6428521.1 sorbosone dehydrogenase family protein [Pantoea piersonii]
MKKQTLIAMALTALLAGCDSGAQLDPQKQTGPNPELPEAKNFFMPPMQVPEGVPWKQGEMPKVAQGLKIEKIAENLKHPRQVLTLPNGDVLVAEANGPAKPTTRPKQLIMGIVQKASGKGGEGGNRITLLRNVNGKWEQHTFIENLFSPFGMQLIGNTLYVANADSLVKFPYQEGETEIRTPPQLVTDLPGGPINHHWTKSLVASPDGSKLYVGIGSNSNITENGIGAEYHRAAVLEVDAATGASRLYATGLRNPTGLQWEPQSNRLWAIVNERDEIGSDLVPDYMTAVQENGFYGWPYSYFGQHVDTRAQPQRPDLVAKAIKPDYALSSHVAPLGLLFYQADNMPQYRGGAFVSEHGSWNRTPLNGYQVVWVKFENGKPVGMPQPVVTGFLTDDQKQVRGLPVGLAADRQGGLLIADDAGNTVWRVSAK